MPPGLRRAISDALEFWAFKTTMNPRWDRTSFNDGNIIINWLGQDYIITAIKLPDITKIPNKETSND